MEDRRFSNGVRKLIAWREAHALTLEIYRITRAFPADERFGITSQLRRASSSIGAQIAEGSRMPTFVHRKLYYDRSYASAAEVDNFLELARDLRYLDESAYKFLLEKVNKTTWLIHKLSAATSKASPPTIPTIRT